MWQDLGHRHRMVQADMDNKQPTYDEVIVTYVTVPLM